MLPIVFWQGVGLKMASNLAVRVPDCLSFRGLTYHRFRNIGTCTVIHAVVFKCTIVNNYIICLISHVCTVSWLLWCFNYTYINTCTDIKSSLITGKVWNRQQTILNPKDSPKQTNKKTNRYREQELKIHAQKCPIVVRAHIQLCALMLFAPATLLLFLLHYLPTICSFLIAYIPVLYKILYSYFN